jgi:hypothetical protein
VNALKSMKKSNQNIPFRYKLKENLKDLKNSYQLKSTVLDYDYYFVHITKAGGTFLKDCLRSIVNERVYFDNHDLKIYNIPDHQKILVSCRHPVDRFVSSFYTQLHRSRGITSSEKKFYDFYSYDINNYIEDLKSSPSSVERKSYFLCCHVGRFSTYSYWLKDKKMIDSRSHLISHIFRVENLDEDISNFAHSFENSEFDLIKFNRYAMPARKTYPPIKSENIDFLTTYLQNEFDLVNHLRSVKGYSPY